MELGAFSISLAVKDLEVSRDFYSQLGFQVTAGDIEEKWLVMRNHEAEIGLYQDLFEKNTLTFNPGLDKMGKKLVSFTDINDLQSQIDKLDIKIEEKVAADEGERFFFFFDPDGNPILISQHF